MADKSARDAQPVNSGNTPRKQIVENIRGFMDVAKIAQETLEESRNKYTEKNFIGQIYTKESFNRDEVIAITGEEFFNEALDENTEFTGYKVYIPELFAVYPNLSEKQIRFYNDVTFDRIKVQVDGVQVTQTKEQYLESAEDKKKNEFKLIEKRMARFPYFFAQGQSEQDNFPSYCEVMVYDYNAPIYYGKFVATRKIKQ